MQAIRVGPDIVKLLPSAFFKGHTEKVRIARAVPDHEALGRRGVDIFIALRYRLEIGTFRFTGMIRRRRVAQRPAFRQEIDDVKVVLRTDSSCRVAHVIGPGVRVPFPTCQYKFPAGINIAGLPTPQYRPERATCRSFKNRDTGCFEKSRTEISQAYQVVYPAPFPGYTRTAGCEWYVNTVLLQICLCVGKRHPVIGSHHYDGIFQLAYLLQHGQHFPQVAVKPTDLQCIVQQIRPDAVGRWQEAGDLRFVDRQACPDARPFLVSAMRFLSAIPKKERLTRLPLQKKFTKIRRVVIPADALGGTTPDLVPVKSRTYRIPAPAGFLEIARPPWFTRITDEIAGFFQRIGEHGKFFREIT